MSRELPSHAHVVVIGAGVAGCSVAYHLTKMGWYDVVLLNGRHWLVVPPASLRDSSPSFEPPEP